MTPPAFAGPRTSYGHLPLRRCAPRGGSRCLCADASL